MSRTKLWNWGKWAAIAGFLASVAIVVSALPTIGMYGGHIAAVWHAPDRIQLVESNQTSLAHQVATDSQMIQETHEDVRDIKNFLYGRNMTPVASAKTNRSYEP